jgi:DNA-binding GntR family transcriptional regulator
VKQVNRVAAPVREQVAQMLRRSIVSGELAPGQRVIEREICEATGASRTSVREALRQLESERLITNVPQHGTVVSVIDEQEAASLYETRAALEALMARTCAERATESELRAIDDAVTVLERTAQGGDPDDVAAAAAELYDRIFEGSGNSVVEELLRMLHVRVVTLPITLREPGRAEVIVAEMSAMARAVIARDAEAAGALAAAHVASSGKHVLDRLRGTPAATSR